MPKQSSDTPKFEREVLVEHEYRGITLYIVTKRNTAVASFDGRINGRRIRDSTGIPAADFRTEAGKVRGQDEIEKRIREEQSLIDAGFTVVRGKSVATEAEKNWAWLEDVARETYLQTLELKSRKNADKALRYWTASIGRKRTLKSTAQRDITKYEEDRIGRPDSYQPPTANKASGYKWPSTETKATRPCDIPGVRGDLVLVQACVSYVCKLKDSQGNPVLDRSPLDGLDWPRDDREPVAESTSEERYQKLLAVADEAEAVTVGRDGKSKSHARATRRALKQHRIESGEQEAGPGMRNRFAAHDVWPGGGVLRMMLMLYRKTVRRQQPVRLLQRKNVILDPMRAMEIAREARIKQWWTVPQAWPYGAIWWEGWKDKAKKGKKRRSEKNRRDSITPMTRELMEEVVAYLATMPEDDDAWFFPSPTGPVFYEAIEGTEGAVSAKTQGKWYRRMEKLAGLPRLSGIWHKFRRLGRTEREGVHPKIVNKFVGWAERKRAETMESRYLQVTPWSLYLCAMVGPEHMKEQQDEWTLGALRFEPTDEERALREELKRRYPAEALMRKMGVDEDAEAAREDDHDEPVDDGDDSDD